MYLANMQSHSIASSPDAGIERFVLVLDGEITINVAKSSRMGKETSFSLHANQFVYFPSNLQHSLSSIAGAGLLVYERYYAISTSHPVEADAPQLLYGSVDEQPILPVDGEIFLLRKLLPQTAAYDFNIHVMDFLPGEYLVVKEVHYNQHGLMLLNGQGIYRLGDESFPVTNGDVIWMGPYVPQWYAALGPDPSRYVIYKDTSVDPITH